MRNERSGRDQIYRSRPKSASELGLGSPTTEHQKFWLRNTRETRTGAASEAYVVLSALVPYWVSQVFLLQRVSDESLFLRPQRGGIMEGGRGRDGD